MLFTQYASKYSPVVLLGSQAPTNAVAQFVQLMLVPALAYDRAGRRLGRGGGYYDRFLSCVDCCTVGLIRAAFLFDTLPAEWNDVPVSAVITEDGVLLPQEKPGLPEEPRSIPTR